MLVWDLISLLFFAWIPSHTDVLRLVQLNYIDNSFITILLFMYHSIDFYSLSRSMVYNSLYDFIILELIPWVCSHKRLLGYDILAFKWTIVVCVVGLGVCIEETEKWGSEIDLILTLWWRGSHGGWVVRVLWCFC